MTLFSALRRTRSQEQLPTSESPTLRQTTRTCLSRQFRVNLLRDTLLEDARRTLFSCALNRQYQIKPFAGGSTCRLYSLTDLQGRVCGVFKRIRERLNGSSVNPVIKEKNLLVETHGDKKIWGLQKKPYGEMVLEINKRLVRGIVHPLYAGRDGDLKNSDLCDYLLAGKPRSQSESFLQMHQLLSGLNYLHKNGVLHGDIKPDNVFMNGYETHLADFGSAICTHKTTGDLVSGFSPGRMSTAGYACRKDYQDNCKLLADPEKNRDTIISNEKARDVFSMGMVLYCSFTGHPAYSINRKDSMPTGNFIPFPKGLVPDKIANLITRMCDMDRSKRPTAEAAFNEFETYLKNESPLLHAEIYELIRAGAYSVT